MAFHNTYNKKNIVEEYKKRFQQILEYTMPGSNTLLDEDDDTPVDSEDDMNSDNISDELPMDNNDAPMGDEMNQSDNNITPNDMEGDDMTDNNTMNPESEEDLTSGFNPQNNEMDPTMMGDENMSMDTMQPDDEVVDITELTDAQEETLEGIEEFDEKFVKALNAIKGIESMINKNNQQINAKIADIENEIKKRNPTATEKMSNRQSVSYPYTISPEDYWKEKEKNSNYSTENDNNGKEQEQYVITNADVNSATDWKNISDSLNDDFLYNQTLNNILRFQ